MTQEEYETLGRLDKLWFETSLRDFEKTDKWMEDSTQPYPKLERPDGWYNSSLFIECEEVAKLVEWVGSIRHVSSANRIYWSENYLTCVHPEVLQWAIDNGLKLPKIEDV